MKNKYRIVETKMCATPKEVTDYINDNDDQEGYKYETRTITPELFKVEKSKEVKDD